MSALLAKSSPEEAARSSIPGIASIISETEKPAEARFSIACALSVAEKAVAAPKSMACCFRLSNSLPVAPEIALTRLICASKSIPVFAINPPAVESAVLTAPIAVTAAPNPVFAIPAILDIPELKPEGSTFVSNFKVP